MIAHSVAAKGCLLWCSSHKDTYNEIIHKIRGGGSAGKSDLVHQAAHPFLSDYSNDWMATCETATATKATQLFPRLF